MKRLIISLALLSVACVASAQTGTIYKHDPGGQFYQYEPATSFIWAAAGVAMPVGAGRIVVPTDASSVQTVYGTWSIGSNGVLQLNGSTIDYNATDTIVFIPDSAGPPPPPPPVVFCDIAAANPQTIASGSHIFRFCWDKKADDGTAAVATGWTGTINNNTTPLTVTQIDATPNAQGMYEFDSQPVNFPVGTYGVTVTVSTIAGSASSANLQLVASGTVTALPAPPSVPTVQ